MIVNELTVFASLTVRFLRGVCQVLRSAQRLPTLHALFSLSSVVLLASLYPAPVLLWIGNPYYTLPPKAYDL